jgi:hypothetical protein
LAGRPRPGGSAPFFPFGASVAERTPAWPWSILVRADREIYRVSIVPVVKRISREPPKLAVQVRILAGALEQDDGKVGAVVRSRDGSTRHGPVRHDSTLPEWRSGCGHRCPAACGFAGQPDLDSRDDPCANPVPRPLQANAHDRRKEGTERSARLVKGDHAAFPKPGCGFKSRIAHSPAKMVPDAGDGDSDRRLKRRQVKSPRPAEAQGSRPARRRAIGEVASHGSAKAEAQVRSLHRASTEGRINERSARRGRADRACPVAQLAARPALNRKAPGSNPGGAIGESRHVAHPTHGRRTNGNFAAIEGPAAPPRVRAPSNGVAADARRPRSVSGSAAGFDPAGPRSSRGGATKADWVGFAWTGAPVPSPGVPGKGAVARPDRNSVDS